MHSLVWDLQQLKFVICWVVWNVYQVLNYVSCGAFGASNLVLMGLLALFVLGLSWSKYYLYLLLLLSKGSFSFYPLGVFQAPIVAGYVAHLALDQRSWGLTTSYLLRFCLAKACFWTWHRGCLHHL